MVRLAIAAVDAAVHDEVSPLEEGEGVLVVVLVIGEVVAALEGQVRDPGIVVHGSPGPAGAGEECSRSLRVVGEPRWRIRIDVGLEQEELEVREMAGLLVAGGSRQVRMELPRQRQPGIALGQHEAHQPLVAHHRAAEPLGVSRRVVRMVLVEEIVGEQPGLVVQQQESQAVPEPCRALEQVFPCSRAPGLDRRDPREVGDGIVHGAFRPAPARRDTLQGGLVVVPIAPVPILVQPPERARVLAKGREPHEHVLVAESRPVVPPARHVVRRRRRRVLSRPGTQSGAEGGPLTGRQPGVAPVVHEGHVAGEDGAVGDTGCHLQRRLDRDVRVGGVARHLEDESLGGDVLGRVRGVL